MSVREGAGREFRDLIIAVASGKGGTGKTTVAANLARTLQSDVMLLDCDVEEPNCHLFLRGSVISTTVVGIPVPLVDSSLCDGCGECSTFCRYHAIALVGSEPLLFPELCHGCGGCTRICHSRAITEVTHRIGTVETIDAGAVTLIQGRLDIGVAMVPPLIRAVKTRLNDRKNGQIAILDAPPGTSCPVIATARGADFVLLVTEPTPFGLHDLTLAVDLLRQIRIPFGVAINKAGSGDDRVVRYCHSQQIPVLLEIPDDRRIAEAYSRGQLMVDALPEYREPLRRLFFEIVDRAAGRLRSTGAMYHEQ